LDQLKEHAQGGRTEETILEWIEKHIGPATKELSSAADVDAFFEENELSVVGFFAKTTGDDFKQFEAVATSFDDIPFAYIADTSVGKGVFVRSVTPWSYLMSSPRPQEGCWCCARQAIRREEGLVQREDQRREAERVRREQPLPSRRPLQR
jgi:hypothetical protein